MTGELSAPRERVAVLVAASGAAWEAEALDRLDRAPGVVLARRCVDLTDLLGAASTGTASVALVTPTLLGLDAESVAELSRAGLVVVVIAEAEDLDDGDAERLHRMGIGHLLVGPELDDLGDLLLVAGEPVPPVPSGAGPADPPAAAAGRVVVVWGPAGAPGRTTVAVGLAAECARSGADTLLLDVDGYGGAVAQHLGVLDESSGLLAGARAANAGQLDTDRLAGLARSVDERLRVLTGLPRPDRWQEVRTAAFEDLVDVAAQLASHVVVDTGFSLEADRLDPFGSSAPQRNQMTLSALGRADEVVVVGAADPVGLARLARGLIDLREVFPAARPRVVVNRTRSSLGWSEREIHGMVEGFVSPLGVHFLPEDRVAADRALMSGRTLAESGASALRDALAGLAGAVLGADPLPGRRRITLRRAGRAR